MVNLMKKIRTLSKEELNYLAKQPEPTVDFKEGFRIFFFLFLIMTLLFVFLVFYSLFLDTDPKKLPTSIFFLILLLLHLYGL